MNTSKVEFTDALEGVWIAGTSATAPNCGFNLLDAETLKRDFFRWAHEMNPEMFRDHCGKYFRMLKEIDGALSSGKRRTGAAGQFPNLVSGSRLEPPVGVYLTHPQFQNAYLDWVLISAFIRADFQAFARGEAKVTAGPMDWLMGTKKKEKQLAELKALAAQVTARKFSTQGVLTAVRDAQKNGCPLTPAAKALLKNCVKKAFPTVALPDGALSPNQIESKLGSP